MNIFGPKPKAEVSFCPRRNQVGFCPQTPILKISNHVETKRHIHLHPLTSGVVAPVLPAHAEGKGMVGRVLSRS